MKNSDSAEVPRTPYLFRELAEPEEIVALLRLRHHIYFDQSGYGKPKPLRLDLTAHDQRSRLFGVFKGRALMGGLRLVFRADQASSGLHRAIRAVVQDVVPEAPGHTLPSEEAFDIAARLGDQLPDVEVEVGRLALLPDAPLSLAGQVVLATIAAIHAAGCNLYLYSCAVDLAPRYARFARPRHVFDTPFSNAIGSDGFVFPRPTVAAVAAPKDSPFWPRIEAFSLELKTHGQIVLGAAQVRASVPLHPSRPA